MVRRYIRSRLQRASVAAVDIERAPKRVTISIHTARPGIVIGRKGTEVDKLRDELKHITGKEIYINIQEIKRPELSAQLVADNIARQLEQRVSFRRAMKKAVASSMRMGAEGIKVVCAGRLGGAEMSRDREIGTGWKGAPAHLACRYRLRQVHGLYNLWNCRGESLDLQRRDCGCGRPWPDSGLTGMGGSRYVDAQAD